LRHNPKFWGLAASRRGGIKPDSFVQFLWVELAQLKAEFCDRWLRYDRGLLAADDGNCLDAGENVGNDKALFPE